MLCSCDKSMVGLATSYASVTVLRWNRFDLFLTVDYERFLGLKFSEVTFVEFGIVPVLFST